MVKQLNTINTDLISTREKLQQYLISLNIENLYFLNKSENKVLKEQIILYTQFLPVDSCIAQRIYHIINNTELIPNCLNENCNKQSIWKRKEHGYGRFCNIRCARSSSITRDKIKQTNLIKYGVEHPLQNKLIMDKIKQTNLIKYGVEHPLQNKLVKEKQQQTNIARYGTSSPLENIVVKEKIKQTNMERYGVEYPGASEEIMSRVRKTNIERYGGNAPACDWDVREKMKKTNRENHGGIHNMQTFMGTESYEKLNNADWLYNAHVNEKKSLIQIALELGCGDSIVGIYLKNHGIEHQHYFNLSSGESELQEFIKSIYGGTILFNTNDCIKDVNYKKLELDILIPDKNIAIEYCGLYWHSDANQYRDNNYHRVKYLRCKEKGIRLLTIFEDEWIYNKNLVKNKLLYIFGNITDTIYARKCTIEEVSSYDKSIFFNETHIQGDGPSSINLGLYHNSELVACIGFIKHPHNFILNRYSTKYNVVGGFSKLLKCFEVKYNYPKIVTFADLRWSIGELYYNNGFIMDKELPPDYSYTKNNKRFHKFNFRHKQLCKLPNYDPSCSESENMENMHYHKIYNCGLLRFIKNYNE